jgi:hypothetical protein
MNKLTIDELWTQGDAAAWEDALEQYWVGGFIKPANIDLERRMETLDIERIRRMDLKAWYNFLHDEYFRWKYTAPNRYATTTKSLKRYVVENRLGELHRIKDNLLALDQTHVRRGIEAAKEILGLGTAGATGLLALLYPKVFATVDQFVVKALLEIPALPEYDRLSQMKPENLNPADGVILIQIMQNRASENNRLFATSKWTPRMIDKVLWTYGRN